jgi:hypothetical protein
MSKISDFRLLKYLRSTEFVRRLNNNNAEKNIILSKKDFVDLKTNYCGLCGKRKVDPVKWFGEEFCRSCVEKNDPDGVYQKELKGKRGFSHG